ncbi:class I SAM-dependent methyltransferase [Halobacteria archaeon HArc-gm2]|nr:class I SAM-dependent methyltransferase [Halobacteria archaeon HArc-gm2]
MTDRDRPSLADRRETPDVYQPAEDSHLLATAAREGVAAGDRALDVGTGSGYVADELAAAGADVVASDLNPAACRQARERGLPVVRADLLDPFRDGAFDVVTFNPPYLPTDPDNEWGDWMETALSGGEDGRAAIDPFLDDVDRVLAPDGAAYLLVSSLTDPDAVRERAAANGLDATEVEREAYPFERLLVLRLSVSGE